MSVSSFANIFSHSVGCLSVLLMVSVAVQKLLSLIRYHVLIFGFIFIILGNGSKKIMLRFMSNSVLPVFFSNFIASGLTFRSLIHLLKGLSLLYRLASFVIDLLTIGAWIYLWAFYPIPLIYGMVLCQYHTVLMTVI